RSYPTQQNPRPPTDRRPSTGDKRMENGLCGLDECVEHVFPNCPLLLYVPLQPILAAFVGNWYFCSFRVYRCWSCRHHDISRREGSEEGGRRSDTQRDGKSCLRS